MRIIAALAFVFFFSLISVLPQSADPSSMVPGFDGWLANSSTRRYNGIPYSAQQNLRPTRGATRVLPEQSSLLRSPDLPSNVLQVGNLRKIEPSLLLQQDGDAFAVPGGTVYLAAIRSPGAKSIRIKIDSVDFAAGIRLFVMSPADRTEHYNLRNSEVPAGASMFSPPVNGDSIHVELFIPEGSEQTRLRFQISEVSHSFVGSGDCNLFPPLPCHNEVGPGYATTAAAVGFMKFVSQEVGECLCTGTMMNTATSSFTPYFLTANHCLNSQAEAQSLRVYWNYNTGDWPSGGTQFTDGAVLLSTSTETDFSFLKLTGNVPGGLSYSGWEGGQPPLDMSVVGIHHPRCSHKRISFGFVSQIGPPFCPDPPYDCNNFTLVDWTSGLVEPGSSGSGLFQTAASGGRLVGTLLGGPPISCTGLNRGVYGRFGLTYHKVSSYLANANCTYTVSPGSANFSASGGNGSFSTTTNGSCYQAPVVTDPSSVHTFVSLAPITINDRLPDSPPAGASPYPATISVTGLQGTVRRVRVILYGLQHTFPDDLDVVLIGPSGQAAMLFSDTGGGGDVSNLTFTIDESGLTLLPDDSSMTPSGYRPTNFSGSVNFESTGRDPLPSPGPGSTALDSTLENYFGTNPNGTWKLFIVDDEPGDAGLISAGWDLEIATTPSSWISVGSGFGYGNNTVGYFVAPNAAGQPARSGVISVAGQTHTIFQAAGPAVTVRRPFDFDGDGKTDVAIFRPPVGEWWIYRSSDAQVRALQFGAATDKIAPADFTGDGKTDVAFWRPTTGEWFVIRSENNTFYSGPFGTFGDIPVPADYDADGKADVAVFRPSTGFWFVQRSSDGVVTSQLFGTNGDHPIAADYDGDGRADVAIYRPSVGEWWLNRTTAGVIAYGFGNSSDKIVPGDYTGDGKADVAFWRPATGEWFILRSEDTSYYSAPFGIGPDIPVPGDYDGDGRFDVGVFRPSIGTWFVNRTSGGSTSQQFGANGDRPIPNAFVP